MTKTEEACGVVGVVKEERGGGRVSIDGGINYQGLDKPPPTLHHRCRHYYNHNLKSKIPTPKRVRPGQGPVTSRYAQDFTIRRLAKCHRHSKIVNLIESQKTDPKVASEPSSPPSSAPTVSPACSTAPSKPTTKWTPLAPLEPPSPSTPSSPPASTPHSSTSSPNYKVSYGILAKSFCRMGDSVKALQVLNDARGNGVQITVFTYTTILDAQFRKGKTMRPRCCGSRWWRKGEANFVQTPHTAMSYGELHPLTRPINTTLQPASNAHQSSIFPIFLPLTPTLPLPFF
ncbi:hypothetical protein PIB30_084203 [Stylosanthes scabra]|uniref:Pentatricopeptide repeat-containing protein n=1 Tax=Stylosanthes scabra TaxID=79078 RepID=A0ABU6VS69_9FABA|nr:hypothetical protein [Stylosanthes scabra]